MAYSNFYKFCFAKTRKLLELNRSGDTTSSYNLLTGDLPQQTFCVGTSPLNLLQRASVKQGR